MPEGLRGHHEGDRGGDAPAGLQSREHRERDHLDNEAEGERDLEPHARGEIAAEQVRDDAEELVEEEQEGELHRCVAEGVEVQQHQHAQCAVGQGERPVGGGDERVVAPWAHRRLCPTLRASSTKRFTYPHSLSYQASTFTQVPSTIMVESASTMPLCGSPL